MGLRQIAQEDLRDIMQDEDGFSWPCEVTDPSGSTADFLCRSTDIHMAIDPGTGVVVTGRQASVAILMEDLEEEGMETICGVPDTSGKPWVVTVANIAGVSGTFRVVETYPDNAVGLMVCVLETYVP